MAADQQAPPRPKPCRFAHAPAPLDDTRTRVVLDLPTEQLQQLLTFLTDILKGRSYA